jgi:hypothetical protein
MYNLELKEIVEDKVVLLMVQLVMYYTDGGEIELVYFIKEDG